MELGNGIISRKEEMDAGHQRENSLQGIQVSIETLLDTVTWMFAQLEMVELQVYIFLVSCSTHTATAAENGRIGEEQSCRFVS